MENKTITYLVINIRGYRLMVKLTAFQAVAMGSSPIVRNYRGGVAQLVRAHACHA